MRATHLMSSPCSTDSVVVLESPREDELLLSSRNSSYQLFLSSGQRTKAVEHGFLESWVHVVSTERPINTATEAPRTGTTNTRCDKLARGRFLDKPSICSSSGGNHPVNSVPTSTDYRSFLAKLLVGVGGRMLSSSSTPFSHHQGHSPKNYPRSLSTEIDSSRSDFFQTKSLMSGEFNNGDSTTVKIGSSFSGSSGEETTTANDELAISNSPSKKSGLRSSYGQMKNVIRVKVSRTSTCTNNTNSNASSLLRSQQHSTAKKKTLRNRVADWKRQGGIFGFSSPPIKSNARKRLGARTKRTAVAAADNSNNNSAPKNQAPSAVKHLGIFNFDAPTIGQQQQTTGGTKATIIMNNHSHPYPEATSPRCNVIVKTVRSESTMEIQFWADSVAHRTRAYGKQHSLTTAAAVELGSAHLKSGDRDEAVKTFQSILEDLHGAEKHSLVEAKILEKLGCALSSSAKDSTGTSKPSQAMEYMKQALNIRCELLGALHMDTIECLNSIATLYLRLEDFSNAQRAYYEVLVLRQAVFGKDVSGLEHPSVAVAAQRLGQVYTRLSERGKALEYLQFAEGIFNSLKVSKDNHSLLSVQQGLQILR